MDILKNTTNKIIYLIIAFFFFFLLLGALFRNSNFITIAFNSVSLNIYFSGLLFGTLFSILKIILMKRTLTNAVSYSSNKAKLYTMGNFLLRYFLTGVVLLVSIKSQYLDFLGAILGIFALAPASYIAGFMIKNNPDFSKGIDEDTLDDSATK